MVYWFKRIPFRLLNLFCLLLGCVWLLPISAAAAEPAASSKPTVSNAAPVSTSRFEQLGRNTLKLELDDRFAAGRGVAVDGFPRSFLGCWGGHLKVNSYLQTPVHFKQDSKGADDKSVVFENGNTCAINFVFSQKDGVVELDPVFGIVMVKANRLSSNQQHLKNLSKDPREQAAIKKAMENMKAPVAIHFHEIETRGTNSKKLGGGHTSSKVFKVRTRKLAADTFEQQVFSRAKFTDSSRSQVDESVFWIKHVVKGDYLYVRLGSMTFTDKGELMTKLILSGTLARGRRVETDAAKISEREWQNILRE